MNIEIGTIDPNRNISYCDIKCLVSAIDYFEKHNGNELAKKNNIGLGIAFQRLTYTVLSQDRKYCRFLYFDFDINHIFRPSLTRGGAEQSSALQTYCRRMGLLDNDESISLSETAKKILNDEITIEDYAFLISSKQAVFCDKKYTKNLLYYVAVMAHNNHDFKKDILYSIIEDDLNISSQNITKFRFDIFLNMLATAGIITSNGSSYIFTEESKVILEDILNKSSKFINFELNDTHYLGKFSGGIFDLITSSNISIYQSIFPNLFKQKTTFNSQTHLKENKILYGAPGTGKTFLAKREAIKIVTGKDKEWKFLTPSEKEHIGFVQFHPSFDYTDFVEGLRPDKNGNFVRTDGIFKSFCKKAALDCYTDFKSVYQKLYNKIKDGYITSYPLKNGGRNKIFINEANRISYQTGDKARTEKESNIELLYNYLCEHNIDNIEHYSKEDIESIIASLTTTDHIDSTEYIWTLQQLLDYKKEAGKPYVFIIDEINRGELSKIFGELFYSIEPDYRGIEGRVTTQYNNMVDEDDIFHDGFYIPENVYIIGTMNDIDRGVESMDFAIRRRFTWEEVTAKQSAINMNITGEALVRMNNLNEAIDEQNNLSSAYHIGGAYFRNVPNNDFEMLWNNHLKGILYEYFRGEPDVDSKIADLKIRYDGVKGIQDSSNNNIVANTEDAIEFEE